MSVRQIAGFRKAPHEPPDDQKNTYQGNRLQFRALKVVWGSHEL